LGSEAFVNFNKHSLVPSGLVAKLCLQHRPARIVNGLRHFRFCKLRRADVADRDELIVADKFGRPLMEMVPPRVSDLGMDRPNATFISGPLRRRQGRLVLPVVAKRFDRPAIAQSRERLKAEVYADAAISSLQIRSDLTLKAYIPTASGVLDEAPRLEYAVEFAGFPKAEIALQVYNRRTIDLHGSRYEWNPAEVSPWPKTAAKSRASLMLVPRGNELATNGLHGVAMQTQFRAGAGTQLNKIKRRRPTRSGRSMPSAFRFLLSSNAKIPHLIAGDRMASQVLAGHRVFDAEFIGEDHEAKLSRKRALVPVCSLLNGSAK